MASPSATPSGSRSGPSTWRSGTGRPAARRAPPPFVPAAPTHDALDRFVGSRPGSEVSHRGATPPAYEAARGPEPSGYAAHAPEPPYVPRGSARPDAYPPQESYSGRGAGAGLPPRGPADAYPAH